MFGCDDGSSARARDFVAVPLGPVADSDSVVVPPPAPAARLFEEAEGRIGILESRTSPPDFAASHHATDPLIRTCDIVIAFSALIVMLPVLVLIGLLVFVTDPGPIFFAHRRLGEGGRHFHCLKFRSMVRNADERLRHLLETDEQARLEWQTYHKLSEDPRILPLGRFLRKSSLDELPQLWNVLRGHMSIVGPRPIVPEETWRYGRYLSHYYSCRPGITGLWQISGRSTTTYRRRVALDVTWSRSRSFGFYCWILAKTVPSVLAADGSA